MLVGNRKGFIMLIKQSELISIDYKKAYFLVKNDLEAIAHYLPSVEKVELVERGKSDKGSDLLTNHWYAKASLPFFLKSFISKD